MDVTFEGGGAIEKFAEWLFPYIKSSLISEIENLTCKEVTTLGGHNLTEVLNGINEDLLPYMNHGFKVSSLFG